MAVAIFIIFMVLISLKSCTSAIASQSQLKCYQCIGLRPHPRQPQFQHLKFISEWRSSLKDIITDDSCLDGNQPDRRFIQACPDGQIGDSGQSALANYYDHLNYHRYNDPNYFRPLTQETPICTKLTFQARLMNASVIGLYPEEYVTSFTMRLCDMIPAAFLSKVPEVYLDGPRTDKISQCISTDLDRLREHYHGSALDKMAHKLFPIWESNYGRSIPARICYCNDGALCNSSSRLTAMYVLIIIILYLNFCLIVLSN